jgi:hypothetical protein
MISAPNVLSARSARPATCDPIAAGGLGRIGLHSLPQADTFYGERCGMPNLGLDVAYSPSFPLRYFEMTDSQAATYLNGSN